MASSEEFFSRLRKLASTVDKETSELKDSLENSETSSYNENRACVLLRETLAEIKDLKVRNIYIYIYIYFVGNNYIQSSTVITPTLN